MRLSEAIRLGAMMKPQAFGDLWKGGGSCALGAAYDALGWRDRVCCIDGPLMDFYGRVISCPACGTRSGVTGIMTHLNDNHHWTREAIADWVATVEPPSVDAVDPVVAEREGTSTRV